MDLANARNINSSTPNGTMAEYGDDNGVYVEFDMRPVHMPFKSQEEGHPVFEDRPHIKIMFPGDKTKTIDRPAYLTQEEAGNGPTDAARFPRQWAAFKAGEAVAEVGLPITEWAAITKSQAAELKAINVHTVEALASMSDTQLSWMGARTLRDKAITWLDSAKGNASALKHAEEKEQMQAQLDAMRLQIEELGRVRVSSPEDETPRRGPGRPPRQHD